MPGSRLTATTFQAAFASCPAVTKDQLLTIGSDMYDFSSEYMKLIIGTTEGEWYPLDMYLEYAWACCFIDYRVMGYNPAYDTDQGAYDTVAQWEPKPEYTYEAIQAKYNRADQDTLKAVYLALVNLDRNVAAASGYPPANTYIYYQSAAYPDIQVWYFTGQPIIEGGYTIRDTSPAGTYNPCYMTNLYGASWTDHWNTCIHGAYPTENSPPVTGADVLANCTGYAQGRALEIYNECLGYNPAATGTHPFINFNSDARLWYPNAPQFGFNVSQNPGYGSIICWDIGTDPYSSAGHVGVVEDIIDQNTIITTESGYGAIAGQEWITQTRVFNGSNWIGDLATMGGYTFQGFILNPANPAPGPGPGPVPPTPGKSKSKIIYQRNWNNHTFRRLLG